MRNLLPNLREISAGAVQPTARPVNTYTPPESQVRDFGNGADSVLSSLSGIMPSLTRFLDRRDEQAQKRGEEKAENAIAGMTYDQRKALIDNNDLPDNQDPWFRAALLKGHGRRVAQEQYEDLIRKQESGELTFATTDDARDYLSKTYEETIERLGGDQLSISGYRELFERYRDRVTQVQAQTEGKLLGQARTDQFFSEARRILSEEMDRSEGSPEEKAKKAHERIRYELYPTFEGLFRMKPKEMDELIVTFAEQAADEGRPEIVNEILFGDRVDAVTGNPVGRIGDKREFAAKAGDILVKADQTLGRKVRREAAPLLSRFRQQARAGRLDTRALEAFQQQYGRWIDVKEFERIDLLYAEALRKAESQADRELTRAVTAERLATQIAADARADELIDAGLGATMQDVLFTNRKTGAREVVGQGRALANEALDRRMQDIGQRMQSGELTPEDGIRQMVDVQVRNGMVWRNWQSQMEVGPGALDDKQIAEGKVPDTLKRGYALYRQIAAVSPAFAEQAAGTSAARVYRTMMLGQQFLGLDESQAALGAIRANSVAVNANLAMQRTREEIERRASSVISGGLFGTTAANSSFRVREQLIETADMLAKGFGIDPKSALDKAAEEMKARTVNYRGHLIPTSELGAMAGDLDSYFKPFAEEWFKKHGEANAVRNASDLGLASMGNGRFVLFDNRRRVPILAGELSARRLYELETERRANAANANRNR